MRVSLLGTTPLHVTDEYGGGSGEWAPGETRTLPAQDALELVAGYPGHFHLHVETNTPTTPYTTRLGRPPRTR